MFSSEYVEIRRGARWLLLIAENWSTDATASISESVDDDLRIFLSEAEI